MNDDKNVVVTEHDSEGLEPIFLTPKRLIRWAAVVGLGILAVLALWQDHAYAGTPAT